MLSWLQTLVDERDVRQLIAIRDLSQFQRFVKMCAARSGQLLNLTALGADCGLSATTAREWLSVLEASYFVMRLQPNNGNFGKRLLKTTCIFGGIAQATRWTSYLKPPMGFKRSKSNQVVLLRRTGSKDSTSGSPSLVSANDNPRSFMGARQAMSEKAAKWWGGKWGQVSSPNPRNRSRRTRCVH